MESIIFFSSVVTTSVRTCHLSFYNTARDDKDRYVFPRLSNIDYRKHVTVNILFLS